MMAGERISPAVQAARLLLDLLLLALAAVLAWLVVTGGELPGLHRLPPELQRPRFFLAIAVGGLAALRLLLFGGAGWLASPTRVRGWAFASLLFFVLSVLAVKLFISLTAVHYFHRALDAEDWRHTFSTDLALGFAGAMALLAGTLVLQVVKGSRPLRLAVNVLLLFLAAGLAGLGVLYVFLGYTYFEWGSYLEPQHFEAMRMAGVGAEFLDLFFRWRTLAAIGAVAALLALALTLQRRLERWAPRGIAPALLLSAALVPALLTASVPVNDPRKVSPSVQSPLLMLVRPVSGNMNGVKGRLLRGVEAVAPVTGQPEVAPRYRGLEGIARGRSVLIFVMESVRRRSVPLYGYQRDNMPFVSSLADHAIVFQNGYVMQPRSSKAMAALALGVLPDPRLQPVSWEESRVLGSDSLFNRLIDGGRRYYIGTAHHRDADNILRFFEAVSNNRVDRAVAREDLETDPTLPNLDLGMSRDFLHWVADSRQPFVALLWTRCAHMPYYTRSTPFGRRYLVDRYDNCLRQVDDSLREVVEGLRSSGRLDETLLVVLGDHGEALGEKFDRGHGNYLYEHSLRIPLLIYNPELFPRRIDVAARFQLKDLPSTLLYLLGEPSDLNQSVNILAKGELDKLYLSNVYQDFKLGVIEGRRKFVYRPTYDISCVYDLEADPGENVNIAGQYDREALQEMKQEVLGWYLYQTGYIEEHFPRDPARLEAGAPRPGHAGG